MASAKAATRIMLVRMGPLASGFREIPVRAEYPIRPRASAGPSIPSPAAIPTANIFITSGSIIYLLLFICFFILLTCYLLLATCYLLVCLFTMLFMFMGSHSHGKKYEGQTGKDKSLDKTNQQFKPVKRQSKQEGN